ncbi:hypothetical protein HERIO_163 [Hepatospora eriocheir]|uniref:Uncharacterized protein n=1 Tax=Hepatospora eriocheir TaxID=1081669 RepID=A0A1X0QE47_9MICR|nr:hypothetical protein HERIO_163 [Hepatospora eriocheir]
MFLFLELIKGTFYNSLPRPVRNNENLHEAFKRGDIKYKTINCVRSKNQECESVITIKYSIFQFRNNSVKDSQFLALFIMKNWKSIKLDVSDKSIEIKIVKSFKKSFKSKKISIRLDECRFKGLRDLIKLLVILYKKSESENRIIEKEIKVNKEKIVKIKTIDDRVFMYKTPNDISLNIPFNSYLNINDYNSLLERVNPHFQYAFIKRKSISTQNNLFNVLYEDKSDEKFKLLTNAINNAFFKLKNLKPGLNSIGYFKLKKILLNF